MSNKHTPAPWIACDPGDYADFDGRSVVILGNDKRIAVVHGDDEEAIANARVIATAPRVLQALLNLVGTMCAADGSDLEADLDAIDARVAEARAVIAEARGRP